MSRRCISRRFGSSIVEQQGLAPPPGHPQSQRPVSESRRISSRLRQAYPQRLQRLFRECPLTLKPCIRVPPPARDLRFRGGSGTIRDWNFRVASEFGAVIASIAPKPGTGLSAGTNRSSRGDHREGRREERRRSHSQWQACWSHGEAVPPPWRQGRRLVRAGAHRRGDLRHAGSDPFRSEAVVRPGCRRLAGQPAPGSPANRSTDSFGRSFRATAWCSATTRSACRASLVAGTTSTPCRRPGRTTGVLAESSAAAASRRNQMPVFIPKITTTVFIGS